jgi:ABC-type xylose transport system permease subunit
MSAIVTARVHAFGGERASTVLSGVTTAIWVNAGLCVLTGLLVALCLRSPAPAE